VTAVIVILGGMTIIAGTLMPWMTFFAGLHIYRGIIGLYGRLIAVGGVVVVALGVLLVARHNALLRWSAALLGGAIFLFSALLLRNLILLVGNFRGDPMMVASPGHGLFVCVVGATLVCGSLLRERRTRNSGRIKRPGGTKDLDAHTTKIRTEDQVRG
jgi:hypothetical protein